MSSVLSFLLESVLTGSIVAVAAIFSVRAGKHGKHSEELTSEKFVAFKNSGSVDINRPGR